MGDFSFEGVGPRVGPAFQFGLTGEKQFAGGFDLGVRLRFQLPPEWLKWDVGVLWNALWYADGKTVLLDRAAVLETGRFSDDDEASILEFELDDKGAPTEVAATHPYDLWSRWSHNIFLETALRAEPADWFQIGLGGAVGPSWTSVRDSLTARRPTGDQLHAQAFGDADCDPADGFCDPANPDTAPIPAPAFAQPGVNNDITSDESGTKLGVAWRAFVDVDFYPGRTELAGVCTNHHIGLLAGLQGYSQGENPLNFIVVPTWFGSFGGCASSGPTPPGLSW